MRENDKAFIALMQGHFNTSYNPKDVRSPRTFQSREHDVRDPLTGGPK